MTKGRAIPENADIAHCRWYLSSTEGGPNIVEVHLWGEYQNGRDSRLNEVYSIRRCIVCGTVDPVYIEDRKQ